MIDLEQSFARYKNIRKAMARHSTKKEIRSCTGARATLFSLKVLKRDVDQWFSARNDCVPPTPNPGHIRQCLEILLSPLGGEEEGDHGRYCHLVGRVQGCS